MASDQAQAWEPPSWWHFHWWLQYIFRDPGDMLDPKWRGSMGIPPQ